VTTKGDEGMVDLIKLRLLVPRGSPISIPGIVALGIPYPAVVSDSCARRVGR
jgi:hypothetical protein